MPMGPTSVLYACSSRHSRRVVACRGHVVLPLDRDQISRRRPARCGTERMCVNIYIYFHSFIHPYPHTFPYYHKATISWAWTAAPRTAATAYWTTSSPRTTPSSRAHASRYLSIHPSIHLSIYLSIHLSIFLSIHLSIYPSIYLSIYLSIYPSIHPSIHLSVCLSIYSFIYLSIYIRRPRSPA